MRRRGLEPMADDHVNVTPLIDVVMCLIIFFLMCSHLARSQSNDQVVLPRAELGQEMDVARGQVVINVFPHNRVPGEAPSAAEEPDITIRSERVSLAALTAYLRREKQDAPDLKIILRADEGLPYQWISPVLVCCFNANIRSINFSTRRQ